MEAWKKVTATVHAKNCRTFSQLWHTGRSSHVDMTNGAMPVAPPVVPYQETVSTPSGWVRTSPHRALGIAQIPGVIDEYRRAAVRAKAARFDGVELHAANGYLPDQFLQDGSNKCTDAAEASRTDPASCWKLWRRWRRCGAAIALPCGLGPVGTWNSMSDSNPVALFDYVANQLNRFGLAYLHVIEPRIKGNVQIEEGLQPVGAPHLRKIFNGKIIAAGGFEPDSAKAIVEKGDADLVAFGRHYLANPDMPKRIRLGQPLNPYDRATFYTRDPQGYIDYPFYDQPAAPSIAT